MSTQRPAAIAIPSAWREVLQPPKIHAGDVPALGKAIAGEVLLWQSRSAAVLLVPQEQSSLHCHHSHLLQGGAFSSLPLRPWSKWYRGAFLSLAHESTGFHGSTTGFGLAQQFWPMKRKKCTVLAW